MISSLSTPEDPSKAEPGPTSNWRFASVRWKWETSQNYARDNIPGACHLPRIRGPVKERFCDRIDFFHAAFRSWSNLILVKGFAERRLTDGDAEGWGPLGNSLGQSTQKKPAVLKEMLLKKVLVIGAIDDLPRSHKMIRVNRFYMRGNLRMPQSNSICVTSWGRW